MADLTQLDKAAALTGKSEVTLRRLIKAGKVPYQKEKTLTGFVYLIDPDKVKAYYQVRGGGIFSDEGNLVASAVFDSVQPGAETADFETEDTSDSSRSGPVRLAVANESGDPTQYWQKKADLYEDRYNQEVTRHGHTREELGVWRGRAEQAQSMILKLLPAPSDSLGDGMANSQLESGKPNRRTGGSSAVLVVIMISLIILVAVVAGLGYLYLRLSGRL